MGKVLTGKLSSTRTSLYLYISAVNISNHWYLKLNFLEPENLFCDIIG